MRYAALLHKDEHSSYGVSFPDLPGCFSGGETEEEAMRNAAEALALHIQCLRDMGQEVPVPAVNRWGLSKTKATPAKEFHVTVQAEKAK